MCFTRPKPLPLLITLVAFSTCVGLGIWQTQRLAWKDGLQAQIDATKEKPPLTKLPKDEEALKALEFQRVKLSGTWRHDIEYHLFPRIYQGRKGYALITPLQLADGRTVLINRGWIPMEHKDIAKRRETIVAGYGKVTGMIRTTRERNRFTLGNQPEMNIWFARDIDAMAAQYGLKNIVPAMVDAVGKQDLKHLPVPSDGTIRLRNDHLSYIITWYGLAVAILVIFLVYHRKK